MFDLFRSRAKAVRYLLGAVLLLVALSMVVTLIPGFVGASYSDDSNIIAEIGDDVLTMRDVQREIQQAIRDNQFPREMASAYVPTIVNNMIASRAVAYQAQKLGFEVTDADVAKAVRSLIPQLFQDGQFAGKEAYAMYLQRLNLTIPEFEANVRKQMLLLDLMNMALEGEVVTDKEIEEEFRKQNEKVRIEYISISPSDYRDQVQVTPAEIQQYYEANKPTFRIPEKRDIRILVVAEDEVSASIQVPEEELRRAYAAQQDRFRMPERVRVRHILLKTTDKSPEEIEKLKAKAEQLLQQLKNGADFAKLAEENSEDKGTAVQGGELGWITRGQTVENFEKTAFSLKPGELSDVITTEYGFHIIRVEAKEKARLLPFEEVKDELAAEKKKQMVYERMQQLADQARAELLKNPLGAEEIAARLGISVFKVDQVTASDPIPELAGNAQIVEELHSLDKAGVTQVYQLGEDRLAVAVVTEVYPEREAELSEVEDQIRERLINQKAYERVQQKQKQLEELMKTANGDLRKIARTLHVKVQTSEPFTRTGNVEGVGAATYMREAFEKPVGSLVGPINAMGHTIVCKVIEKIPADMTKLPEERDHIRTALQRQRAQERRQLLEDSVLTHLINEGEVKIYDRTIQRLISIYSSS